MSSGLWIDKLGVVDGEMIKDLLALSPKEGDRRNSDFAFRQHVADSCDELVARAYRQGDQAALATIHDALALIYDQDFRVTDLERVDCESQPILRDVAARFERAMVDAELAQVPAGTVDDWPRRGREFVHWIKAII